MVMAAKFPALPVYPKTTIFSSPCCQRSRYSVWACLCKTSFDDVSWRFYPRLCFARVALPSFIKSSKRISWSLGSSVDGGGLDTPPESNNNGETRLVKAIQFFRIKLSARFNELKKGFPMKVLFFLVGFYCATAFATMIGQTGDWDILSAGLAMFVVEGIGALMYKSSFPLLDKVKSLITVFNYWKAGLSMGLFLDAFKYEMDSIFWPTDLFDFQTDIFPSFL
ncbi:hypothetical protein C5167_005194 [Papaver somniferum]|uniref:Ycf20-like protein n=2 Tax=Papaver somniferum TaxID=3469 RepID=A0A4Y7J9R8_PAPSO|nr:ycf20-like protein isoform X2 [Papaver somniferum]RZC57884.1 hypothetical protein C5167_005194 [Papaver somniferum]